LFNILMPTCGGILEFTYQLQNDLSIAMKIPQPRGSISNNNSAVHDVKTVLYTKIQRI